MILYGIPHQNRGKTSILGREVHHELTRIHAEVSPQILAINCHIYRFRHIELCKSNSNGGIQLGPM